MTSENISDAKLIMLALAELIERVTELQNAKTLESIMEPGSKGVFAATSMTAHDLRKRAREIG